MDSFVRSVENSAEVFNNKRQTSCKISCKCVINISHHDNARSCMLQSHRGKFSMNIKRSPIWWDIRDLVVSALKKNIQISIEMNVISHIVVSIPMSCRHLQHFNFEKFARIHTGTVHIILALLSKKFVRSIHSSYSHTAHRFPMKSQASILPLFENLIRILYSWATFRSCETKNNDWEYLHFLLPFPSLEVVVCLRSSGE